MDQRAGCQLVRALGRVAARGLDGVAPGRQQRHQLVPVVAEGGDDRLALDVGRRLDRLSLRPALGRQCPSATRPRSTSRASAASSCSSDQARVRT